MPFEADFGSRRSRRRRRVIAPRPITLASVLIHGGVVAALAGAFRPRVFPAWRGGMVHGHCVCRLRHLVADVRRRRNRGRWWSGTSRSTQQREQGLPALGVIVASHNEAAVLPNTLAKLLGQTHSAAQIVIADDGSSDATAEVLTQRFGLDQPVEGELSAASTIYPISSGCASRTAAKRGR